MIAVGVASGTVDCMEPTENCPSCRRPTAEEIAAALGHGLPNDEVIGHLSLDTLLAYRREVRSPRRNAVRKLLGVDVPRDGQTPQQIAETTGHRSDTAQLYLEMRDAFRPTDPDTDWK